MTRISGQADASNPNSVPLSRAESVIAWFERRGIALAVVAGLIARVVLVTLLFDWAEAPVSADDLVYVRFSTEMLQRGYLTLHHFPVGFPLFIAPFLKFGGGFAFVAIRIAHVLLGCLAIVLVSRIATLFYGARAGLIAAWLTAGYPPLIYFTGRIMSETLFIALLTFSLLQLLRGDREESRARSALGGAVLAVASIVRSNLVLMFPFVPLWYLLKRGSPFRERFVRAVLCGGFAFVILMLPGVYFKVVTGEFLPFATNAGQTLYGANNPMADGGWVQVNDYPDILLKEIPLEVRSQPAAFSKAQQKLAVRWISENPLLFLGLLPKKFANAWIPGYQHSETTARSVPAAVMLALSYGIVLLGAIVGRLMLKPAYRDGLLLAVLLTYTGMSLVFYGNPRIGLFCAPVLIVYAAGCGRWLLDRISPRSSLLEPAVSD